MRIGPTLCLALLASLALPRMLGGHEVPARVAITAFVRPEGSVLRVIARVPLEAMRDVDFPLVGDSALDLVRVQPRLAEAARLWVADYLTLEADGSALGQGTIMAARVARPDDRSFTSYDAALAHLRAPPLLEAPGLRWQQALLDVLIEYPLPLGARAGGVTPRIAITPALAHLGIRTTSVMRLVLDDGSERPFVYEGNPGRIELDPAIITTALRFVRDGFRHILGGLDHLLFVFCLVLPVRRLRPLVIIVTAFTLAHSVTLAAAALGFAPTALWFPPLVELLIALSIVVLAVENVLLPETRLERRWMMAFGFGLIHGFGFSFALAERLQFAGAHLVTSLAAFNVGIELGQLLVLAAALPLLALLRRHAGATREWMVTTVGSVLVAHTAWHWMTARADTLGAYREGFTWPTIDATFGLAAIRFTFIVLAALAVGLAMRQILHLLTLLRSRRPGARPSLETVALPEPDPVGETRKEG